MALFEVQYGFKCPAPECLKQNISTITITAAEGADARELAVTDLDCSYCHKKLPNGYFVHTAVKEIK
jgi:hypothetical protein